MKSREAKYKQDNDMLISTVHQTLSKDVRTDAEKEALLKLFLSKQQQANENLIHEQSRVIDSLKSKCNQYERELKNSLQGSNEVYLHHTKEYKDEITALRGIVHRLNAELSIYQCKYPQESQSLQTSIKVNILNS